MALLDEDKHPPAPGATEPPDSDRLDSWKEIATYLKRDVRTVHRWEAEQGLPVRRHLHKKRGTVYAYKSELEAWWNARQPSGEESENTVQETARYPGKLVVAALILISIVAVIGYLARGRISSTPQPNPGGVTLLVLPFDNPDKDPEQEYFSDGMTEEMIAELAKLQPGRLGVIARTSAMQYKASGKGIAQIARELRIDYVLESSVRRSGRQIRITARLVEARNQTQVWAHTYERELRDVLAMQSELASAISREIALQLTPQQKLRLTAAGPVDPDAYEAYLRGLYYFDKLNEPGLQKSIEYFQQAIAKQPEYAPPYSRMARAYGLLGNFSAVRPEMAYPPQRDAALKALELDSGLYEAYCALGWTKLFYDRDWQGARSDFERAVELAPNSALARQAYATYFVIVGEFDRALAEIRRAQQLDPISLHIMSDVGFYLFFARRTDESIAQLQKVLEMDPNFSIAHFCLAQAFAQKRMFDQSIAEFELALKSSAGTNRLIMLGYAYASAGNARQARQVMARMRALPGEPYVSPYYAALIYSGLGQTDRAFESLEVAYRDRYWLMAFLKADPRLDPLRADPRFADLLRRMAFPETSPVQSSLR